MEPFHILRLTRDLAKKHGIDLSPSELMEVLRILLCPAEREYIYEDEQSLLTLIKRIKQGAGVSATPLSVQLPSCSPSYHRSNRWFFMYSKNYGLPSPPLPT